MLRGRTRGASARRGRGIEHPARDVPTAITLRALLVQLGRGDAADVAEALDDEREPGRFQPSRSQARSITITTPAPVASFRNTDPPIETGLPVTISGTA